jgi:hypothetical protein
MLTAGTPPLRSASPAHGGGDRSAAVDRSIARPVGAVSVLGRDGSTAADRMSVWQRCHLHRDVVDRRAPVRCGSDVVGTVVR